MTKRGETAPESMPGEDPSAFDVTLEEFCSGLSGSDKRVELIAGFYADARATGPAKAPAATYQAAFAAFVTRPA